MGTVVFSVFTYLPLTEEHCGKKIEVCEQSPAGEDTQGEDDDTAGKETFFNNSGMWTLAENFCQVPPAEKLQINYYPPSPENHTPPPRF